MVTAIITEISPSEFSIANSRRTHATLGLAPNANPGEATFEATFPASATAAGLRVTVQRGAQSLVLSLPAPVEQADTATFANRLVGWRTLDISGTLTLRLRVRDLLGTVSSEEWVLQLSDVPATTTVGVRGGDNCQVSLVEADPLVEVQTASLARDERTAVQVRAAAARNTRPLPMVGCAGLAILWAQDAGDPVSAPAGPTSMGPTTLPNPLPPPSMLPACLGEATVTLPAVQVATPLHYTFAAVAGEFSTTGAAEVTVLPVADTPTVTPAETREDTQTTAGLVITRNAADGPEVTHFKITNITGGTLLQHDGTTAIINNTFITAAEGNAGLRFTPALNSTTPGSFVVRASLAADDSGLSGSAVASITVLPVADTPTVTPAETREDTQTTAGLVITRNAADGSEVTHFKITNISGGTLFQHDGTTAIPNNTFITAAEGGAGLRFTPSPNSTAPGSFLVWASLAPDDSGLGGASPATATIAVTPVADTPSVTPFGIDGYVVSRNPADGPEVTHFKITAITGQLFLSNNVTPVNNGNFITAAQGVAGLKFRLLSPLSLRGFTAQASTSPTDSSLGGSPVSVFAGG